LGDVVDILRTQNKVVGEKIDEFIEEEESEGEKDVEINPLS
jgi:hypothetical protein